MFSSTQSHRIFDCTLSGMGRRRTEPFFMFFVSIYWNKIIADHLIQQQKKEEEVWRKKSLLTAGPI